MLVATSTAQGDQMKIRKGLCGRLLASCALGLLASTITAYAGSASVS